MHPRLIGRLLDEEADAVRANDFLVRRVGGALHRDGHTLVAQCAGAGGVAFELRFDGPRYDSDPLSLVVCDADSRPLPGPHWPGALYFGQDHPILRRPFCCLRGLAEYHLHPSHVLDPWERSRPTLRFPTLLAHVLDKAGIP